MSTAKWLPLESNPDVINKFLENLGVPTNWAVSDVFALDEDFLTMVPSPVLAVLLLFPTGQKNWEYGRKLEEETMAGDQTVLDKVFFMKQTIRNACGTVALIHSVANNTQDLNLAVDSPLQHFLQQTKGLSPEDKGKLLEKSMDIGVAHEESAQEGQTETPNIDDEVTLHFVALVNVNGKLYELDGRRSVPIPHGDTTADSFLKDACKVCKGFMERDPENLRFTVLSLGAAPE